MSKLADAIKAVQEEEELEALVEVLGEWSAQDAAHLHQLGVLVATAQVETA